MANIKPTQNFVLVQFVNKNDAVLFMPNGQRNPNTDIIVIEVGPDVPQNPPLEAGAKLLLRGDAKIFGIDDKQEMACISYPNIMAIIEDETASLTTEQIDALVAAGNS